MFLQLFSKKSLFLLHFMVFCRGKLAENALRNSHRCHRFSQMLLLGKNLPQNTRISQNLLLRIFSHRFHSAQMLTSGGALVSARLCRLPEQEVHQPSNNCTNRIDSTIYLVGAAETAAPPERSAPTATLKATTD